MKDIGGVLVNGDSSSTTSSALDSTGDDDYVFTEDQRRAALELQSLYRKLGLEDLDDGFEEGLSAYDDPHFDIVARLHEVNSRFEEDETPLESDRHRKVRFKETLVDLVVPISPVRNSHSPPEYDYAEYDDDFDDDFSPEELRNMIDDEDFTLKNESNGSHGMTREEEYDVQNSDAAFVTAIEDDLSKPSAPPLSSPISMTDESETKVEHTEEEEEKKAEELYEGEKAFELISNADEKDDETVYDEEERHLEHSYDEDDYGEIHIMKISSEQENVSDDNKCSLFVKPLVTNTVGKEFPEEEPQGVTDAPSVLELANEDLAANDESISHLETVPESDKKHEVCELAEQPKDNEANGENKGFEKNVPYDQKLVSPLGTKPKKPTRMSSPPCKPRSAIKKQSPSTVLRTSAPVEVRQVSAPPTKSGNSRSRYGLTEELRQELKRLKLLEAAHKKQREHEQAEERRRRQEDADSAFKAWLEMKKRTKGESANSGRDSNARSPTRKVRLAC